MTKFRESGENEVTIDARREAARTGRHICDILKELLRKAKKAHDSALTRRVQQAQKYEGCRNIRKRRNKK